MGARRMTSGEPAVTLKAYSYFPRKQQVPPLRLPFLVRASYGGNDNLGTLQVKPLSIHFQNTNFTDSWTCRGA